MSEFPEHFNWLLSRFGKVIDAHQKLGKVLQESGPLDNKMAQLVQLAGAAANGSEGGVHSHVKRALEAGATTDEIYHTLLLLTSTIGFPAASAALSWAKDLLED